MIIAIDGLGVNGKSTLAKMIADKLGFKCFNSGAIYRCIALEAVRMNLDLEDVDTIISKVQNMVVDFDGAKVLLNGEDVSKAIRTEEISVKSTKLANSLKIKAFVKKIQTAFVEKYDTVIEGRDMCTRVVPNADVKFYLYSDFETRVSRLWNSNLSIDINQIRENLTKRDKYDIEGGNFIKPIGAIEIDTTNLSIEEVFQTMMEHIK